MKNVLKKAYQLADPGIPYIALSVKQWREVYYAVTIKAEMIRRGKYGPCDDEANTRQWSRDLDKIGAIIAKGVPV